IERGFMQREIQNAAYSYQREIETKQRIIVGVNQFVSADSETPELLRVNPELEEKQRERIARVRAGRDSAAAAQAVARVRQAAADGSNLMPPIIEAVRRYATLGEIADAMRAVFGEHRPSH